MIEIKEDSCKSCGLCIKYCPKDVLEYSNERTIWGRLPFPAKIDKCIGCRICEMVCPDFAINYYEASWVGR